MRQAILSAIVSITICSSVTADTNSYAWVNKSVELASTNAFQFFAPEYSSKINVTIQDGEMTKTVEKSTNETHTITFRTKPVGTKKGIFWSYFKLRVLDASWAPEKNRKILGNIAEQIANGFDLPLQVRKRQTEVWHRMILLLDGEPVITLCLQQQETKNEYQFATSFIVPEQTE